MKKILLFLCVIGVAAMMTSCLERSENFQEASFVYIAVAENGVIYGRTIGRFTQTITSPQIQQGYITPPGTTNFIQIVPGDFFEIFYAWDEANDFTELEERVYAHNVTILGMSNRFERGHWSSAPASEPMYRIAALASTFVSSPTYWGDNWIISYRFYGGRDTPPTLSFHKREISETNANEVTIDIDVRIHGVPQVTNPHRVDDAVVLNMMDLRRELQRETNLGVIVRFHFYQPNSNNPTSIISPRWMIAGTSQ